MRKTDLRGVAGVGMWAESRSVNTEQVKRKCRQTRGEKLVKNRGGENVTHPGRR